MKNVVRGKARKSLIFALIMIGFTATAGQIIVVREFIVVFYGNELCLGLILANWLLWGAVGSWLLGRLADRIKRRIGLLAFCEISLAILLPALILAARSARIILKAQPGELIGLAPISIFTFIILSPLCAILGFLFSLGARMYPGAKGAKQIGHVYILEGVGASIGGLLTSLILIRHLNSFQIAMIIGALNLAAAATLRTFLGHRKILKMLLRGAIIVPLALNIYLLTPVTEKDHVEGSLSSFIAPLKAENLHNYSLRIQWDKMGLKDYRNSIYSNLAVVGGRSSSSFYSNGLHMFTIPSPASAEQVAHFPMLGHPEPKNILLIGGGVGGSLAEILKHPSVEKVDYVELDPSVIELAQKWSGNIASLGDPRVTTINIDGRLFARTTKRKYDVAILDLPDPFTAQLNRFYTMEFFQQVSDILNEKGIFSLGVMSSANYVGDDHQKFLSCILRTLESVFPEIIAIPADDQAYFISCKVKGILTYDEEILSSRLDERQVESLYVSRYQLPAWLESWRVNQFSESIHELKDISINRDFRPVSYYYDMVLWSTQFSAGSKLESAYRDLFKFSSRLNLWLFILPAAAAGGALFLVGRKRKSIRREYILLAVMVTGFAEIAFEVIVSLAFQIIYGYMYYKLGLILTAFMVGLIAGGMTITRIMDKLKDDLRVFMLTQIAVCIYPLILLGVFWLLRGGDAHFLGANIIFPILPAIAGFIGGFQFPLATKIYLKHSTRVGRVAGLTYGVDLIGSCAGAFLVSAFLVPIIGIPNTCFAVVLMSIISLILLSQNYFGTSST